MVGMELGLDTDTLIVLATEPPVKLDDLVKVVDAPNGRTRITCGLVVGVLPVRREFEIQSGDDIHDFRWDDVTITHLKPVES